MATVGNKRPSSQRPYVQPEMPTTFQPLQHPRLVRRPPEGKAWIHQIKFDGYRMQANVCGGEARIYTRNGYDWTDKLPALAADLAELPPCILDGELCAVSPNGQSNFSGLRKALNQRDSGELVYFVFDILWGKGEDLRPHPLSGRQAVLQEVLGVSHSERLREVESFELHGPSLYQSACLMGLEGTVSKRLDAPYRAERGAGWEKSKCRPSQEVVIGGWKQEPMRPFKGLLVGVYAGGRLTYAGSIKTGFGAASDLLKRLEALEAPVSPFQAGDPPRKTAEIHWVRPELVAAAEIADWTGSGKLRQASFKGLREDKRPQDVTRELPSP